MGSDLLSLRRAQVAAIPSSRDLLPMINLLVDPREEATREFLRRSSSSPQYESILLAADEAAAERGNALHVRARLLLELCSLLRRRSGSELDLVQRGLQVAGELLESSRFGEKWRGLYLYERGYVEFLRHGHSQRHSKLLSDHFAASAASDSVQHRVSGSLVSECVAWHISGRTTIRSGESGVAGILLQGERLLASLLDRVESDDLAARWADNQRTQLAMAYLDEGSASSIDKALQLLDALETSASRRPRGEMHSLTVVKGRILLRQGDYCEAARVLEISWDLMRRSGQAQGSAEVGVLLAEAHFKLGDQASAKQKCMDVLEESDPLMANRPDIERARAFADSLR